MSLTVSAGADRWFPSDQQLAKGMTFGEHDFRGTGQRRQARGAGRGDRQATTFDTRR